MDEVRVIFQIYRPRKEHWAYKVTGIFSATHLCLGQWFAKIKIKTDPIYTCQNLYITEYFCSLTAILFKETLASVHEQVPKTDLIALSTLYNMYGPYIQCLNEEHREYKG